MASSACPYEVCAVEVFTTCNNRFSRQNDGKRSPQMAKIDSRATTAETTAHAIFQRAATAIGTFSTRLSELGTRLRLAPDGPHFRSYRAAASSRRCLTLVAIHACSCQLRGACHFRFRRDHAGLWQPADFAQNNYNARHLRQWRGGKSSRSVIYAAWRVPGQTDDQDDLVGRATTSGSLRGVADPRMETSASAAVELTGRHCRRITGSSPRRRASARR